MPKLYSSDYIIKILSFMALSLSRKKAATLK